MIQPKAPQSPALVSVVMPAYNVERYLEEAAESVLRQTHTNLELIIVNDGSTDSTADVAAALQRRDPRRVRLLTRRNGGLSAARNTALAAARGQFIALLDSDDMWLPEFLERQLTVFAGHPEIDLVTGNVRFMGSSRDGQPVRPWPDKRPPITLATIITDEQAVFVMTVFRRHVYETVGGFDESLRTNEDFDYWLRAALAGFRFTRNAEPLGRYRKRDDSLSADAVRMLKGALRVCAKVRPSIAGRPEAPLLDRQVAHYETELDAALAREAFACGDVDAAAAAVAALHARRPSIRMAIAAWLARHSPRLFVALYKAQRRARHYKVKAQVVLHP